MREGAEDHLAAEHLHALDDVLELMPVVDGLAQRLVLFPGKGHRYRLGLDLASPGRSGRSRR